MTYQQVVSYYPSVILPGEPHSATQAHSKRVTAVSDEVIFPGTIVEQIEVLSHSRVKVANVTGATTDIRKLLIVERTLLDANTPYAGTPIGQISPVSNASYSYQPGCALTLFRLGSVNVVAEKAIDPNNPVYVRLANPVVATPQLEGIGFVTDTADGADTLELTNAQFISFDDITYQLNLDPSTTDQIERDRISMTQGYGVVAIDLNVI